MTWRACSRVSEIDFFRQKVKAGQTEEITQPKKEERAA
jgi:hypothetical protein